MFVDPVAEEIAEFLSFTVGPFLHFPVSITVSNALIHQGCQRGRNPILFFLDKRIYCVATG